MEGDYIDEEQFINWRVKAKNLVVRACGAESEHFKLFEKEEKSGFLTNYQHLKRLRAVFLAAREDFECGYLLSVRSLVQAEVFDSELEQAKELLANDYCKGQSKTGSSAHLVILPGGGSLVLEWSQWFRQLDLAPFDALIWPHLEGM